MSLRIYLTNVSKGDNLSTFWRLYAMRAAARPGFRRGVLSFLLLRSARRHGGYVGPGAVIRGRPALPHGLHGVFISQYADIGPGCRIYQNVTIGEVRDKAPIIGPDCTIGAGAVLVGDIRIGRGVKIGAGAVVSKDVPDYCTVVAQQPRVIPPAGEPEAR